MFDAFAEGGWRTPGWLQVPAATPDEIGTRAYTPTEMQPWPTSSDVGGGLLGQPLKTATLSFLRQPLHTNQPPQYLEASVQVNKEWRIREGPARIGTPTRGHGTAGGTRRKLTLRAERRLPVHQDSNGYRQSHISGQQLQTFCQLSTPTSSSPVTMSAYSALASWRQRHESDPGATDGAASPGRPRRP